MLNRLPPLTLRTGPRPQRRRPTEVFYRAHGRTLAGRYFIYEVGKGENRDKITYVGGGTNIEGVLEAARFRSQRDGGTFVFIYDTASKETFINRNSEIEFSWNCEAAYQRLKASWERFWGDDPESFFDRRYSLRGW